MQILSRLFIVTVLLGSLAYGSYAFGKYVLSAHLLNESPVSTGAAEAVKRSTRAAEAVTRQTDYGGSRPKVEVKILPAGADGEGPPPPTRPSLLRRAEHDRSNEAASEAVAERAVEHEAKREGELLSGAEQPVRDEGREEREGSTRTARETSRRRATGRDDDEESRSTRRDENAEKPRSARRDESDPLVELGLSKPNDDANSPISGGGVYVSGKASDKSLEPRKKRKKRRKTEASAEAAMTANSGGSMVPVPEAEAPRVTHRSHSTVITDSPVPRPEGGESESPVPQPE